MVPFQHKRYVKRIEELIKRGEDLASPSHFSARYRTSWLYDHEPDRRIGTNFGSDAVEEEYNRWEFHCTTILESIFTQDSRPFRKFKSSHFRSDVQQTLNRKLSILKSILEDIQGGYFIELESVVAHKIDIDVLDEAEILFEQGHDRAAAVLGRVVLEDALRRIAKREGLSIRKQQKKSEYIAANNLNIGLQKIEYFSRSASTKITSLLQLGNAAAHPDDEFEKITREDLQAALTDIRSFIEKELQFAG